MKNLSFVILILLLNFNSYAEALTSNYDRTILELKKIQSDNKEISEFVVLGLDDQKFEIKGLRISLMGATIPKLVVAAHHGNEMLSVGLAIQFANDVLNILKNPAHENYDAIKDSVFYVFPVLNIAGYNFSQREARDSKGLPRDPNRDYPDPCVEKKDFYLNSTRLLADFMRNKKISSAITIHGYVGSLTYPWGLYLDNSHTDDHAIYSDLGNEAVLQNQYLTGTHADIVYPAAGSFEDWAYFELGTWTLLMEMDFGANILRDSQAMLSFFSNVPKIRSYKNKVIGNCTQRELDRLFDGVTPNGRP